MGWLGGAHILHNEGLYSVQGCASLTDVSMYVFDSVDLEQKHGHNSWQNVWFSVNGWWLIGRMVNRTSHSDGSGNSKRPAHQGSMRSKQGRSKETQSGTNFLQNSTDLSRFSCSEVHDEITVLFPFSSAATFVCPFHFKHRDSRLWHEPDVAQSFITPALLARIVRMTNLKRI